MGKRTRVTWDPVEDMLTVFIHVSEHLLRSVRTRNNSQFWSGTEPKQRGVAFSYITENIFDGRSLRIREAVLHVDIHVQYVPNTQYLFGFRMEVQHRNGCQTNKQYAVVPVRRITRTSLLMSC